MDISKDEYILRSLRKIAHKKWELFIVARILHKLDDDSVEFVTQQLVRLKDGRRALTDLYFPQFTLHLEIDEPHHPKQLKDDERREQDIVEETGHEFHRIAIAGANGADSNLSLVRADVDEFVETLRARKRDQDSSGNFEPWDWETRYSPDRFIAKGEISVSDNVVFRRQIDALRCFGFQGKGWQKGAWRLRDGSNDVVWFPRLYEHGMWRNELSQEGTVIYERALNQQGRASVAKQRWEAQNCKEPKWIVFAKGKDPLGFNLLRYVGTFAMNFDDVSDDYIRFDRLRTTEKIR